MHLGGASAELWICGQILRKDSPLSVAEPRNSMAHAISTNDLMSVDPTACSYVSVAGAVRLSRSFICLGRAYIAAGCVLPEDMLLIAMALSSFTDSTMPAARFLI